MFAPLSYFLPYMIPIGVGIGVSVGGAWNWLGLAVVLLFHPVLDLLSGEESHGDRKKFSSTFHTLILILYLPIQLGILVWGLNLSTRLIFFSSEWLGLAFSVGAMTGAVGITAAHELIHRRKRWQRAMGVLLLSCVCYAHFRVEHVYGHHRNVATPRDPETARRGESLYHFWFRACLTSFPSAWKIEGGRLAAKSVAGFEYWRRHRIVHYLIFQGSLLMGTLAIWGFTGFSFILIQSWVAVLLLQTVDYIEHYGLERREVSAGRYEPATEFHTWDSRRRMTNLFLFNLGKHAHHHAQPLVHYEALENSPSGPRFELGYSAMLWLAFCPPIWKRMMEKKLETVRSSV